MPKEKYVKICPKCNSPDVFIDSDDKIWAATGIISNFVCNNCGFRSKIFPEVEVSELKNLDKPHKVKETKQEKVDTAYGKFIVFGWWKVLGPFLLIFSVILLYATFKPQNVSDPISVASAIALFGVSLMICYFAFFTKKEKKD
ncbi:MAG: hypothetical protein GY861_07445 [bacterium]|nr:hypothetical protein [bacterium]